MKWTLAGLVTVFAMELHVPAPADACGVKLTVKSGAPKKNVARSSNPSQVLLLGSPPRRLERDLVAAGHKVDTASTPAEAKKKPYAVVITDPSYQNEARANYQGSKIIVRSNDVVADVRTVESSVRRTQVGGATTGTVVAAGGTGERRPIAAGPARETREPIAGGAGTTPAGVTPPAGGTTRPATTPPTRVAVRPPEPKPPEPKPDPKPPEPKPDPKPAVVDTKPDPTPDPVEPKPARPAVVAKATASEVYFSLGNAEANTRAISRAVKWMNDNPSLQILVEGHADPTGSADANMALSQRRADWVKDQLVAAGIDSSRIEVVAHGDTKLKYGAADGRNRRVAIIPKP